MSAPIPSVKLEGDDMNVKMEDVSSPSAVSDTYMDDADDDPELNFDEVNRLLWTSKLPKYLWEVLAKASDDDEIELGTIRVEGSFDNPDRISLMLNDAPIFTDLEKEYVLRKPGLQQKKRRPGQVLMFSEKNKPGYKQRANVWDQLDEDGNMGQGRSQLYEQALRDEKRKENKGKFTPYARNKPIPKITALAGTVHHESETVPVENAEHKRLESERTKALLSEKKKDEIQIKDQTDVKTQYASVITRDERSRITQVSFLVYMISPRLTCCSKRTSENRLPRTTEQLEPTSRRCSTIYSRPLHCTDFGDCVTSASGSISLSNGSRRTLKRLLLCIGMAILMESGSCENNTRTLTRSTWPRRAKRQKRKILTLI